MQEIVIFLALITSVGFRLNAVTSKPHHNLYTAVCYSTSLAGYFKCDIKIISAVFFCMGFSGEPTVENIRSYIKKELGNTRVPQRKTVEKWLEECSVENIERRIEDHVSYWKKHAANSPTSREILSALAKLIRDKLKK